MQIAILGSGSWGLALGVAFSHIATVRLWARDSTKITLLKEHRFDRRYLPEGVLLPEGMVYCDTIAKAVTNADLIVIATPIAGLRSVIKALKDQVEVCPGIIWACKGFEENTCLLPHQIIEEEFPGLKCTGALLGPSFATEVALGLPTALTIATCNSDFGLKLIHDFRAIPNFRVYANHDVIGAEVGAGVKNIMAIAVGISDGLKLGYNARAALITRSLNELGKLVVALGGKTETIYGLTGVGDLILTCTSDLSRNRTVGLLLAAGKALPQILAELGHVAEGVYATQAVYARAHKLGLDMPILDAVYNLLYNGADVKGTVARLLQREPKSETR